MVRRKDAGQLQLFGEQMQMAQLVGTSADVLRVGARIHDSPWPGFKGSSSYIHGHWERHASALKVAILQPRLL